MVRIDLFIFGYRRLKIEPEQLSLFCSLLLRASIPSTINNDGSITIRERDFEKIRKIIKGRIDFTYSESLGISGWWRRLEHKAVVVSSFLLSVLIVVFLSGLIWDIRVDGNEKITDTEIILALRDSGFEIGGRWGGVDLSKTETNILDSHPEIAWININRRGSVAYISLIEKEQNNEENINLVNRPSNLISTVDCVIEEITVRQGIAVVKPGDVVKRGDILVVGVLPEEAGGGLCPADASVIGRVKDTVSVQIDREYDKKIEIQRKIYSCSLKIFNFSINIFKRYRNLTNECVIIENEIKCSLFDKVSLPFSIITAHVIEYSYENAAYSDEQLCEIGAQRLSSLTMSRIEVADLLKMRTTGEFTEKGYRIENDITFLTEISERVIIDTE